MSVNKYIKGCIDINNENVTNNLHKSDTNPIDKKEDNNYIKNTKKSVKQKEITTMKKRAKVKTNMNNIPTMNIDGIVITGEEVRMAMNTNIFIGERIIAFTKDFNNFKEEVARTLYLFDRKPELVGGLGLGETGNAVFELFDHVLSTEEKMEHIKAFTSK